MKTDQQLMASMSAALFLLTGIIMLALAIQTYRYGLFELCYSTSLMSGLFLGAAGYAQFAPAAKYLRSMNQIILGISVLLILLESRESAEYTRYAVFPLALLSFVTLRHAQAMIANGIVMLLLGLMIWQQHSLLQALGFLSSFALLVALASTFAQLHQKRSRTLVELEIRDPLTGAYNFRHLEDTLGKEVCRADRTGKALSLIALEIDYFPQIIDLHGAVTTQALTKQFSDTLSAMIRAGDSQYCDANHCFYLLLPCTPPEGVVVIAERIRRTIEEQSWPVVDSITVSLGCTAYKPGQQTRDVNGLINDANIALIEAQKNGHNRVCHHD